MMLFFRKKRFNSKAEKIRLINKIEGLQLAVASAGMGGVTLKLDKIINLLDDKGLPLRREQVVLADSFLADLDGHISKYYEAFLLNKCDRIFSILRGDLLPDENTITSIKNQDRLFEMLGELRQADDEVKAITKKMDAALGKDKAIWLMLNSQRRALNERMQVINKKYQTLLESQNALTVAAEVRKAKEEAEAIMLQSEMQDLISFEENAEFTTAVADGIRESSDKMHEAFMRNFGGSYDAYEYEHALEEKLMAKTGSAPEGGVPIAAPQC